MICVCDVRVSSLCCVCGHAHGMRVAMHVDVDVDVYVYVHVYVYVYVYNVCIYTYMHAHACVRCLRARYVPSLVCFSPRNRTHTHTHTHTHLYDSFWPTTDHPRPPARPLPIKRLQRPAPKKTNSNRSGAPIRKAIKRANQKCM